MDKLRFKAIAALIFGLLCTHAAWAQTAANLTVISGNGQIICEVCSFPTFFQPMIVRVTDATGQPVANKTVNWTLLPSATPGVAPFFFDTTVTDGNGVTVNPINQTSQTGSIAYPFLQSNVQASADGINTVFTVTQALSTASDRQTPLVFVRLDSPAVGSNIQGTAGGTSTTQVKVHVDSFGTPVVRASLRVFITTDPATTASVACATGAGADIGSVLTDANGDAVCNLVFGPISGNNEFTILVGGVDPAAAPNYILAQQPIGYRQFSHFQISVRAGVPGMLTPTNGNNQNVNPGQPTSPFVVKVTDASGLNPVGGQAVTWSVSPVGAVTFNPPVSTSDALGSASTVGTLSSSAVGAITVRATLGSLTTTFNLNANVTLTGLQKVSGDSQTAPASQPFGQPLVVQVNGSTGQPVANFPVNFTVSGPATLSAASATTNASGRAQINVTAGATQGNVTVTATAGSFTQTFSLTVIPPGPVLTTGGFLNGADFQQGALSPCGVATIKGAGIASTVQGVVVPGNIVGPLPYQLANVKVSFSNSQAPIYNVANVNGQQQVTVQVPCDVTPGNVAVSVNVSGGNGTINIPILPAAPGVFQTTNSDGVSRVVAVRPDGSFVSIENPARKGETIRAYTTGLGAVTPPIGTNSIPVPGTDSVVVGQVIVGVNNSGTRLIQARLAPNLIGVYEVAFEVPSDVPAGNDIVFSVGINVAGDSQTRYSAGTKIPIL